MGANPDFFKNIFINYRKEVMISTMERLIIRPNIISKLNNVFKGAPKYEGL